MPVQFATRVTQRLLVLARPDVKRSPQPAFGRLVVSIGSFVAIAMGFIAPAVANATDCPIPRYCADPDVTTTLVAQQPSVTLSTPVLTTFATYRVKVTHYTTQNEQLKPVTVALATKVLAADGITPVPSQSASIVATSVVETVGTGVTVSCTVPVPPVQVSTIDCTISQLNAKGPPPDSATFDVRVQVPTAGGNIKLTADTSWKEPDEGQQVIEHEPQRSVVTPLVAPEANKAASFVPPAGSLFTVNDQCTRVDGVIGCAATPSDPWTTTITVKQGANLAEIAEAVDTPGCPRAGNLLDCRESDLKVPNYAGGLVIFLRRDASTIKGGNIKHGIVYYTATTPAAGVIYPLQVPACTDSTYGVLPKPGIPCINYEATADRPYVTTEYKKKTVPNHPVVPPQFADDWEFVIYAVDNGRYNN